MKVREPGASLWELRRTDAIAGAALVALLFVLAFLAGQAWIPPWLVALPILLVLVGALGLVAALAARSRRRAGAWDALAREAGFTRAGGGAFHVFARFRAYERVIEGRRVRLSRDGAADGPLELEVAWSVGRVPEDADPLFLARLEPVLEARATPETLVVRIPYTHDPARLDGAARALVGVARASEAGE